MKLIMNNIHMDLEKCSASTQITLDGDLNLAETMPDLEHIIFKKAEVQLEDEKITADHVSIKGKMKVEALYATEDEQERLAKLSGEIPFEETVFLEGIVPGDEVDTTYRMEDLSISVINSRKVSIRSVISFLLQCDTVYEEAAATELEQAEQVQYHTSQMEVAKLAVHRKDIFRLHQEVALPGGMPNVYRIIWHSLQLVNVEFKPVDHMLLISGELTVFVLYENEQEDDNISFYEVTIPVQSSMECEGCQELMTSDIKWELSGKELDVKPDFDGEQRLLCVDLVMDLNVKLYQENRIQLVEDVYGMKREMIPEEKVGHFKRIIMKRSVKSRRKDLIAIPDHQRLLQLIHSEAQTTVEDVSVVPEGVLVVGVIFISCLYVTGDDKTPYACVQKQIPYEYVLETKEMKDACTFHVSVQLAQMTMSLTDASHMEATILLDITGLFFEEFEKSLITKIDEQPFNKEKWKALPMLSIYVVQPGDSLWKIGKKYYMTVDDLKQLNGLTDDEIYPGQKLILMKKM